MESPPTQPHLIQYSHVAQKKSNKEGRRYENHFTHPASAQQEQPIQQKHSFKVLYHRIRRPRSHPLNYYHHTSRSLCNVLPLHTWWTCHPLDTWYNYMAAISCLSMPMWLMLLSESLATFNQIRTNIAHGGSYAFFLDKMCNLIYSFAIVGAVSLVIGMPYVGLC